MHIQTRAAATRAATLALAITAAGLALPAHTAHAATATVTCTTNVWKASYYANTTFSGTAKKTACDTSISENYGTGDPAGVTLPKDNFGVRWTLTRNFGSGGPFSFAASAQDGIRVYLDGTRKINIWKDVTATQKKTVNVTIPKGKHTLRVDFAAFKGKANVAFTYKPRTSASVDKVKPLAPTGLKATYADSTAKLTWAKNAELDLAGYRVYRNGKLISGNTPYTARDYADSPAATGATYTYTVAAVDKAGNASAKSSGAAVKSLDRTAPAAPSGVRVGYSEVTHAYTIAWSASSAGDLAGYHVMFYNSDGDGTWFFADDHDQALTGTSFTDTDPQGEGQYAVTAVDKTGNTSARSATAVADPQTVLLTPVGLRATSSNTGVSLTWTGDSLRGPHYSVYRAVPSSSDTDGPAWTKIAETYGALTSYTDTTGDAEQTYLYGVAREDGDGNDSGLGNTVSGSKQ